MALSIIPCQIFRQVSVHDYDRVHVHVSFCSLTRLLLKVSMFIANSSMWQYIYIYVDIWDIRARKNIFGALPLDNSTRIMVLIKGEMSFRFNFAVILNGTRIVLLARVLYTRSETNSCSSKSNFRSLFTKANVNARYIWNSTVMVILLAMESIRLSSVLEWIWFGVATQLTIWTYQGWHEWIRWFRQRRAYGSWVGGVYTNRTLWILHPQDKKFHNRPSHFIYYKDTSVCYGCRWLG